MSILGSHNSWTYLPVKKWWMKIISWTAKCQDKSIVEQYEEGVRCFDLRIKKGKDDKLCIAHGLVEFEITQEKLNSQLSYLDKKGDVSVRVLHEERRKVTLDKIDWFRMHCSFFEARFPNILFFSGRNLVNWDIDYVFMNGEPTIEDFYGSVKSWYGKIWPWLWAVLHKPEETDKEVLLIDFV